MVRTFKIYPLSNFRVYNKALLTIITMLNFRSAALIHLITGPLYNFDHHLPICLIPYPPSSHHSTVSMRLASFRVPIEVRTYRIFLCLTWFTWHSILKVYPLLSQMVACPNLPLGSHAESQLQGKGECG